MKTITATVFALLMFTVPALASAASFVVTPSSGSYKEGDTITLNISVNPAGSTIYTAMLDARFWPSTFQVVSFTLNDAMLPLKTAGYDALDNSAGVLTKTGGYTGGITTTSSFGTLVLRAKTSGTGTFTVADSSKLLDGNNADQQSDTQTLTYTIASAPAPQTTSTATSKPTQTASAQKPATETPKATTSSPETQKAVEATSSQAAAVATSGVGATLWVLMVVAILVAFGVGYFAGLRRFGL